MSLLHATYAGEGSTVILLHGFCETHHIWHSFQDSLAPFYQVVCPDLPGFGESPMPLSSFSIGDVAELVYEWLYKTEISTCTVIGHSLGGYVALELGKKYPDLVDKIGLFHSTVYKDNEQKVTARNKTIEFIEKNGLDAYIDSFFHNLIFPPSLLDPAIRQALNDMGERAKLTTRQIVIAYLKAMRDREEATNWIKTFPKPLLFIAGMEDLAVTIDSSREQSQLSNLISYHELERVAHLGMIEDLPGTLRLVKNFLAS